MAVEKQKVDDVRRTIERSLSEFALAMSNGTGIEQDKSIQELAKTLARLITDKPTE